MSERWAFAEEERARHVGDELPGGYRVETLERRAFWDAFDAELESHFPPEVFFDGDALRAVEHRDAYARLREATDGCQLSDFWLVRDAGGRLAAGFTGSAASPGHYTQWVSTVHREHRRRGLYSAFTRRLLAYTAALGFDLVQSYHAPSNNAILIAKLRLGFRVLGLEIAPQAGTSLRLGYFHSPAMLRAYEFRCGLATLDDDMVAAGRGAMPLLAEQIRHGMEQRPEA